MADHTPGPWFILPAERGSDSSYIASHDGTVGLAYHGDQFQGQANARVMTAAPELLAALHGLLDARGDQWADAVDQAHDAIAKATGG